MFIKLITYFSSSFEKVLFLFNRSPLEKRFAKGAFWAICGTFISRGSTLVASIFVARILGGEVFGELGIIQSTVGMFGAFAGFGLGLTATKHVAELYRTDTVRTMKIIKLSNMFALFVSFLMSVTLYFTSDFLAMYSLNAAHLSDLLKIGSIVLFFTALSGVQTGSLAGFEAFRSIAKVNIVTGLISFPILILSVYFASIKGAIYSLGFTAICNYLFNYISLRNELKIKGIETVVKFKECVSELSVLWKFSLPSALISVLVGPVNWLCAAFLVNQEGGYVEMGLYSAANQWRIAILFLPSLLCQVILPVLSSIDFKFDKAKYINFFKKSIYVNIAITLIIVLPIMILSDYIMTLYGLGFESGSSVLKILAITSILISINNVIGQLIVSKGNVWAGFLMNFFWAISLIIFAYTFIQSGYGALGLAFATLLAYVFHTCWQLFYLSRMLKD